MESRFDVESRLTDKLTEQLSASSTPLPYLFVGSGLSLRYLNLPNWEALMVEFTKRSHRNPQYELSKANGRLEKVASSIAEDFFEAWFNEDEYLEQRRQNPQVRGSENVLKVGVAQYIKDNQQLTSGRPGVDNPELAEEILSMRNAKIDGIITTNYDNLLEQIYSDFPVFIGQSDLLLGKAQFIGEIYKIHGSVDSPTTLTLTAHDYETLQEKNPYLVAKLLTIFAEHPIIFIGYSIEDEYIQAILVELVKAVGEEKSSELTRRFYFVAYDPDPNNIPSIGSQLTLKNDSFVPMTIIQTHHYKWIWNSLSRLHRPIPTNLIRSVREQIYQIVRHPNEDEHREKVHAIPFGSGGDDVKFVYGFGSFSPDELDTINKMGQNPFAGSKLRRDMILEDILGIGGELNAEDVLTTGIPDHIEPQPNEYIPVHKYLIETGRVHDGEPDFTDLDPIIETLYKKELSAYSSHETTYRNLFGKRIPSIKEIFDTDRSLGFQLQAVVILATEKQFSSEDIQELRNALVTIYQDDSKNNQGIQSPLRMAICQYSASKWMGADSRD